ncbi:MAG: hypothetical protein AABY18_01390 [Candidatus Thermoplasmatota archaeon]
MAGFSKFDPNRPVDAAGGASNPVAARRARLLKWINWVVLVYTAIGFGFIAYWLVRS